jgi:hypothetical protein
MLARNDLRSPDGCGRGEHGLGGTNRRDDGHLSRPHAHERGRVAHGLEELRIRRVECWIAVHEACELAL